ncbi:MAG: molybdopterin-dependent oxidoreductase [Pseudomonadales bacterium]|nr:molybdopterin-dependent oxidoreductase [Pseudomonadales bacterium]
MNLIPVVENQEIFTTDTTCPYCGVGCGVTVSQSDTHVKVSGDQEHPANAGRLCVKGSALHETIDLEGRLLQPIVDGKSSTWNSALSKVADHFRKTIEQHGPDSVAFYLSGQLLTEDYYIANKLMKGFIGSANIDTNSRLCMASAVVAHKRAFGADAVPGCYEDLEMADVLFFVGSNAAYAHPIVFQRIAKAKKQRDIKIVVLDPRRTATCDIADLHLPLKAGTDAFFYNGLLVYLADNNKLDGKFLQDHCDGFDEALKVAREQTPTVGVAASLCDVSEMDLLAAYSYFAENDRVVSVFSQGINQSSSGVDKGNALINCHLATGKIGREGATPFSITGQPNAMGGREVGGLANQLAAHMSFEPEDIEVVQSFWNATRMATKEGLKAVDLFDAVLEGKVKAIWIMGTNPVVSMPNANKIKAALEACDMVAVSDCMADTDTTRLADVVFPATTWGEKEGTVTNSERTISLQKSFAKSPGEAKHDWQIIADFAKKLGFVEEFDYQDGSQIFAEHAALSGFKSEYSHKRAFNISQYANINKSDYQRLKPTQWPITTSKNKGTKRLFEDGKFYTENGRAKFIPITARLPKVLPHPNQFVMNTGRIRDQWHTMTRTGKASRLLSHTSEPYVQIHPDDADRLGIQELDLVECTNQDNRYLGKAKISSDQRLGELFIPMHWNSVFASNSRAGALVYDVVDPLCGQPEFKHSPVNISKYISQEQGLLLTTQALEKLPTDYWSKITLDLGNAYYFSDKESQVGWSEWATDTFSEIDDWVVLNGGDGGFRTLGFVENKLRVALLVGKPQQEIAQHHWLASQLGKHIDLEQRFTLLAGAPGDSSKDPGAIVCSCFQIGVNQIKEEINNGVSTVDALGEKLKCGTNCGSCIPELSDLLVNSQ